MENQSVVARVAPVFNFDKVGDETRFDAARYDLVAAIATLPHEAFGWLLGQLQWIAAVSGGFQPDSQAALRQLAPLITAFFEASQKPDVGEPASSSGLPSVNQWRREG